MSRAEVASSRIRISGFFQNGSGNAHTLSLSARKPAAAIANRCLITVFAFHDKLVGICYFRSLDNFFHCGTLYAESYVVEESVIEKNCFLIHIADNATEVGNL